MCFVTEMESQQGDSKRRDRRGWAISERQWLRIL
jgi:hypothetical protein